MIRGHFGSVELVRDIFNPSFQRTLSTASTRYADSKEGKKVDGVFSWLRDIFKSDNGIQKSRNTITDRDPVTVLDYPETNSTSPIDTKLNEDSSKALKQNTNRKYIDYEQCQCFLRRNLLVLTERINIPIRTIMGCTPRNTKPPIREPNMPEKQEKKEEKKEQKKKKPVIRMEGSLGDQNASSLKTNIHDNLDVNMRNPWGVGLPEELEKNQNTETQPMESNIRMSLYDAQAVKNLQTNMSSSKDFNDTIDTKIDEITKPAGLNDVKQETGNQNVMQMLNPAQTTMTDNKFVDEDYNIPPGTNFDAEISAWKDLALRSKVPVDPSKEELVPVNSRGTEMLSIRPEPPSPKLDVQAVPSTVEETMVEEEDDEQLMSEVRTGSKSADSSRVGSLGDVQKLDSKKLHTGTLCSFRGPYRTHNSSRVLEVVDNNIHLIASDFSTNTEGGWQDDQEAKEMERPQSPDIVKPQARLDQRSNNTKADENPAGGPPLGFQSQQIQTPKIEQSKQANVDVDFADNSNTISDRDAKFPLSNQQDEDRNRNDRSMTLAEQDRKHVENERQLHSRSDDFQSGFDYASTYEDEFYPGYEFMNLEAAPEKPTAIEQSTVVMENVSGNEGYSNTQEMEFMNEEYTLDDAYIRLPGDPYPYSKEHFHKWHFSAKRLGLDPSAISVDSLPPMQKMRTEARPSILEKSQDKSVRG